MKQVLQSIKGGAVTIEAVPRPVVRPRAVLIASSCSVISTGTEKMTMELAQK